MDCNNCFNHRLIENLEKRVETLEGQNDTFFETLSELRCDVETYKESVKSIKEMLLKIDSTVEGIKKSSENKLFQILLCILSAVAGYITAKGGV